MKKSKIFMGFLICEMAVMFSAYGVSAATFAISSVADLENALSTAASNDQDDVIQVAAGTYSVSSPLVYSSEENCSITLSGEGKGDTVFDGEKSSRILSISTGQAKASILIRNISFQNAATAGNGGALEIFTESASIALNQCTISDSAATGNDSIGGGASLNTNAGIITVSSCKFLRNRSKGNVGGLYAGTNTGDICLTDCTFEGNSVNNTGGSDYWGDGGGALLYSDGTARGIVQGNVFRSNIAEGGSNPDGGGLMIYLLGNGSTATVENNIFTSNHGGLGGGGCFIRMNESSCTVTALNNTFSGNRTTIGSGGGMLAYVTDGTLAYSGNIHSENHAGEDGGGAWLNILSGRATIFGNSFASNSCGQNGGGLSISSDTAEVAVSRNLFYTNTAGNVGGGFSCATTSGAMDVLNNTISNNMASVDGGGMNLYMDRLSVHPSLQNNILWNDSPNELGYSYGSGSGTVIMTYSCVSNASEEPWFGIGCISDNPLFVDAAEGDFRLRWTNYPITDSAKSPCIDTGDPAAAKDSDNTRADMGALAYATTPGDVNWDNLVNLKDAVLAVQVLCGRTDLIVHINSDVNGNKKTDLAEAIYILQKIAGLR